MRMGGEGIAIPMLGRLTITFDPRFKYSVLS